MKWNATIFIAENEGMTLADALTKAYEMGRQGAWVSPKEELPDDFDDVIIKYRGVGGKIRVAKTIYYGKNLNEWGNYKNVVAWMPY